MYCTLDVIRRGIRLWSNEGDLIWSPFAGIGSEGYIALEMGRRFIGSELKASYWKQAVKNLTAARASTLFDISPMICDPHVSMGPEMLDPELRNQ